MITNIITRLEAVLSVFFIIFAVTSVQGCDLKTNDKGENKNMETHYIGRFSIAVPTEMKQKIRSSKLRFVEIKEVVWLKDQSLETIRTAEWERIMKEVSQLIPKKGTDKVIIKTNDFPNVGKWVKGMFFHDNKYGSDEGVWTLLMDAAQLGVWLKGDPTMVEDENVSHKMFINIENIARAYQPPEEVKPKGQQSINHFYLQHGAINMPYLEQEESIARFEGHPLVTKLLIEMEMDCTKEIETQGLINETKAMLAVALVTPGGSITQIRLGKRDVAGMAGEEAVLKVREGKDTNLIFTWEFNGKDDSGEYPTTRINMESPEGNLDEKLKIWDAILDSMKPMFVRKN